MALLVKTLIFTLVVPGTVIFLVPRWLTRGSVQFAGGAAGVAGIVLFCLGAALYLRCAWEFAAIGRGTPAPIDPPRKLVVTGAFQYLRNPFYVAVLFMLLGEAALLRSVRILQYAGLFFLCTHLFVVLYEEPDLRARFGDGYLQYCAAVHRWVPRLRAWTGQEAGTGHASSDLPRGKSQ